LPAAEVEYQSRVNFMGRKLLRVLLLPTREDRFPSVLVPTNENAGLLASTWLRLVQREERHFAVDLDG
jgi:hypothetical protein